MGSGCQRPLSRRKTGIWDFGWCGSFADQLGAAIAFHSDALGLRVTLQIPAAVPC